MLETTIQSMIASGRIVDVMLAFLAAEILIAAILSRRHGSRIRLGETIVNAGAGGSLMLALRASLTGAGWPWIALFILLSLMFHAADVAVRRHYAGTAPAAGQDTSPAGIP